MKASDYIVEFLISKGITDVFGYPGGMVTHLMDSFKKYSNAISAHVTYHEQGAAFAACGYAQASGKIGVAYATSGPGATNLITGICNAYFDSIPALFITGQVNSNEVKGEYDIRQKGFQETDIISIVKPITKYAVYVCDIQKLPGYLNLAFNIATTNRKGPVLLDIPMNIFQEEIHEKITENETNLIEQNSPTDIVEKLQNEIEQSFCPCFLIGNGVKIAGYEKEIKTLLTNINIPIITSMLAFDIFGDESYGFIGAYGTRTANFIAAKCDLIISIGTRLDIRQVGINRLNFAPQAKIIRFDVDENELKYKVHEEEIHYLCDMKTTIEVLKIINIQKDFSAWISMCDEIKASLQGIDDIETTQIIKTISEEIPENAIITTDVGQNQVWVAQAFKIKAGQKVLFSGGLGAMGYSLPAAIGACYGVGKSIVYCISGDGGMQMNIQELQFIARERLPVKIIVLNNNSLGMIRHFQEMYFDGRYFQTKPEGGYTAPDFSKIGEAYGIRSFRIKRIEDIKTIDLFKDDTPALLEILISENTYIFPKLEFGKMNQDQEPLIDRKLYGKIMDMTINDFAIGDEKTLKK